jgi:hypothetical protein
MIRFLLRSRMLFRRSFRLSAAALLVSVLPALIAAQNPIGELAGSDASVKGSVELTGGGGGTQVISGSTVSAGMQNVSLRLQRGGEVRVCRGSSVSVTASSTGRELMIGLSSGTIETHYQLAASADTLMTPDFQIQLQGPGNFHFAISADERGNTCVQSLANNTGSILVTELMGDSSHQVKPQDQVFFRSGKASNAAPVVGNCGCPAPPAVLRAEATPPQPAPPPVSTPPAKLQTAAVPVLPLPAPPASPTSAPPPPDVTGEVHVEVDAPFVFRASQPIPPPEAPYNMARIQLSSLPLLPAATALEPPPEPPSPQVAQAAPKKKKKGFWSFLTSIFRG